MKLTRAILPLVSVLTLVACATPKNIFVLIPDPEGNVGQIIVHNSAGEQVVTEEGGTIEVKDGQTLPQQVTTLSPHKFETIFHDAIRARPNQALQYVLYFEHGLAEFTANSKQHFPQIAQRIVKAVNDRTPCEIRVVGHTDTSGSDMFNFRLGLARAQMVADKLVALGIHPEWIDMVSHGENELCVPSPDNTLEPRNRRVEVIVY